MYERKPLCDVQSKNYHNRDVARNLWLEIHFLKLLFWPNIMKDVPECVGPHSKILKKKNVVLSPAALGTKYETRHTSLCFVKNWVHPIASLVI